MIDSHCHLDYEPLFNNLDDRICLVKNKAELESAKKSKKICILSPSKIVGESVNTKPPINLYSKELAVWIASEIKAARLVFITDQTIDGLRENESELFPIENLYLNDWNKF